jgi:ribosomal-protein-alanine N-acetyltransferase
MLGTDIFRHSAELGYWLGESFWSKGLATEAVQLITKYALDTLKISRIYAGVFETNPGSARVLEKSGYFLECRQKKSVIKDGRLLDQLMYVLVR